MPYYKITTATDANTLTTDGVYAISVNNCTNLPTSNWGTLFVSNNGTLYQIYIPDAVYTQYKRIYNNNSWGNWVLISAELTDSGWINAATLTGTWEYFQYRKVGNRVTIRGRASTVRLINSFSSGTMFFQLPSGYRPSKQVYMLGWSTGMVMSRMFVAAGGLVGVDWSWNFYTDSMDDLDTWFHFETSYYVD